MNLILRIPDEVASKIAAGGGDLERRALEALVLEEYRAGRMTTKDLRQALGFEVLDEVDGFLKAHGVYEPYTVEEIDGEVASLTRFGF